MPLKAHGAVVLCWQIAGALAAPKVQIGQTTVIGKAVGSNAEFLGLNFAFAERFSAPVDIELDIELDRGGETIDATRFGPCCPQVEAVYAPNQDEACLNLNVFAPWPRPSKPAPVLFFIHGGGGTTGCSAQALPTLYNGTSILERLGQLHPKQQTRQQAVVVTINYRLSVLANLFLDHGIPDNLQARDQLSALRWVHRHIAAFGGDPGRVLAFGESGGGNAVQMLAGLPQSEGMLHHFISESGTFGLATGFQNASAADAAGRELAASASLNCTQPSTAGVLACLRSLPAALLQRSAGLAQLGVVVGRDVVPVYPPRALERPGAVNPSLRTMTAGWNDPDNFNLCASAAGRAASPTEAAAYLRQRIPLWTQASPGQVAEVLAAYNVSGCTEGTSAGACCTLANSILIDAAMRCPAHRTLSRYAKQRPGQQYWYHLSCCPTCPAPASGFECVCQHTSELQYVFGTISNYESRTVEPSCELEPSFRPFSDAIIRTWVGIAANGSHNGPSAAWPPFDTGFPLLHLDERAGAAGGPAFVPDTWNGAAHHCDLWERIDNTVAVAKFGPP